MPLSLVLPQPALDVAAFKAAMGHLASGVALVAWGGAEPKGILVSSLTVLSTQPARVLFGVEKSQPQHGALLAAQRCSISLLGEGDEDEAQRFSGDEPQSSRFASGRWRIANDSPPQLTDSLVRLDGFIDQRIDADSHSLFIIRVGSAVVRHETPLVFFDRAFRRLAPERQATASIPALLEA
jgi:flavin reductase (DIM6/NTAB) family NADH-FMN oxidoreductase RutF